MEPGPEPEPDTDIAKLQLLRDLADQSPRPRPKPRAPPPPYSQVYASDTLSKIVAVRLPEQPPSTLWDVSIADGRIASVEPHAPDVNHQPSPSILDGANRLLAPSLCHAHIHLDKCFLLHDPKYSDLQIERGDFQEAMDLTAQAKARFDEDDLVRRGRQLVEESIHHGVTVMRAFVEVDGYVELKCLDAGLALKEEYQGRCEIQLCAFAQLPLFSGADGGDQVRKLMAVAAREEGVDALGSTPYVEQDRTKQVMNVRWISALALAQDKFLDFHLDYFLEKDKEPLIWSVLDIVKGRNWVQRKGKQITLGHCTRLSRFDDDEWSRLKQDIEDLPVSFVGLPTSDLFMMRTPENVRGTLPVVDLIRKYGLEAAISINNVGNAFTPQGSCDPLSIASLGVGLYQAGTKKDAQVLYEAVSSRAKSAIGCECTNLSLQVGMPADFVLFDRMDQGWRCRKSIVEVVYDPAGPRRQTICRGRITAF